MYYNVEKKFIDRAHRVGPKRNGADRPIVVKFALYKDKEGVLSKRRFLHGTNISLSEDFSKDVRDIRRRIWHLTEKDRKQNDKVFLVYDKVKINGRMYRLNYDWTDLEPINYTN